MVPFGLLLGLALVCPFAGGVHSGPGVAASGGVTAFVGVTVVPMSGPTALLDQTVLVSGDRITDLGPAAAVKLPDGATRIDGQGRWLMPGLADMHVHTWSTDDFPLFLANGVTTVRNMFGSPKQLEWRRQIAAGKLTGPTIITAGPIIDGDPPTWPGSTVLTDPADAEKIVLEQQEAGYDFLKCYSGLKPDCYEALAAAAKKHGLRFMGHVPGAAGLPRAIAAGQSSVEHLDGWPEATQAADSPTPEPKSFFDALPAWEHVDDARIAEVAKQCIEHDVWNCPTLLVLEKWVRGDDAQALLERPEMRYVSPMLRSFWSPERSYLGRMPDALLEAVKAGDADRKRCVGILHKSGARLLAGTDMGNPFVVAGFGLHEELANLVAAGLSPYEALRASTSGAAEFMQAAEEWGTVEVGRRADLLLLEANPLDDVRNAARRVGVMVRGRWFEEAALSSQLEELAARFAPAAESPAKVPAETPAPSK
jgi:imidazolonepropionase-like amidohydrolase